MVECGVRCGLWRFSESESTHLVDHGIHSKIDLKVYGIANILTNVEYYITQACPKTDGHCLLMYYINIFPGGTTVPTIVKKNDKHFETLINNCCQCFSIIDTAQFEQPIVMKRMRTGTNLRTRNCLPFYRPSSPSNQ